MGDYVTLDQLDMLLSLLPTEETNLWGMGQLNVNQGSIPTAFREFCREWIEGLRLQMLTPERSKKLAQALVQSCDGATWEGQCVLGDLCGENHMPEVGSMFKEMPPRGLLAFIQRKQLCLFCFRHTDSQPCPSHSLLACPIQGCMHIHHRLLHDALQREEVKP